MIKGIFGYKEETILEDKKTQAIREETNGNFFDEIRVYREEKLELIKLQNQYEKDEIDLCVMSNEEIHELNSLYKRQITDLKSKLDDKKTQLNILKNKLANA